MRLLIVNECYSDNLGDQAIAEAMRRAFSSKADIVDCCDFSFRRSPRMIVPCECQPEPSPGGMDVSLLCDRLSRFFAKFKIAHQTLESSYDAVIIGGGQLVLSNRSFPLHLLIWSGLSALFGSRVHWFSVGVGDRYSFVKKVLIKVALWFVESVYVRDKHSANVLLRQFGVAAQVIPDIAYFIDEPREALPKSCALVSPVEYSVHTRYSSELGQQTMSVDAYESVWLDWIEDKCAGGARVLVCPTTWDDYIFSQHLVDSISPSRRKQIKLHKCDAWNDFLCIARQSNYVFSGRMHALILGHIAGAQIIPLCLSNKIKAYRDECLDTPPSVHRRRLMRIIEAMVL